MRVFKAILMGCVALLLLAGCNTQKRDIKRLDAYFMQYGDESARLSNLVYPCFTGKAKSDTVIIKAKSDTIVQFAGLHVDSVSHDTVFRTQVKTKTITNKETLVVHDTVTNNRLVYSLNGQIRTQRDSVVTYRTQRDKFQHQRNMWMIVGICACSLILIFIAAKVIIFFYGGAISKMVK